MTEYLMTILGYALPFLFVFTVVVFIHELGHFLVARWSGVFVETFSIGMGKELFSRTDRYGTKWRVALLPLGGYCKMRGENDGLIEMPNTEESPVPMPISADYKDTCYEHKNVYARLAIASAGPVANFILAVVIFWGIFFIFGIRESQPQVVGVLPNSPAVQAGFQVGDDILAINEEEIKSAGDVVRIVSMATGERLNVLINRGGVKQELFVVPQLGDVSDGFGSTHRTGALGVQLEEREIGRIEQGVFSAFGHSVDRVGMVFTLTFSYLGQLVAGKQNTSQLSGPVRIVKMTGEITNRGIIQLIAFMGLLSISLGIINLFPVPGLDGGHILFYIIEVVKGSPLSEAIQANAMRVGLVLILCLMVFVTINDIVQLGWLGTG